MHFNWIGKSEKERKLHVLASSQCLQLLQLILSCCDVEGYPSEGQSSADCSLISSLVGGKENYHILDFYLHCFGGPVGVESPCIESHELNGNVKFNLACTVLLFPPPPNVA